jgi:hypothetical protein
MADVRSDSGSTTFLEKVALSPHGLPWLAWLKMGCSGRASAPPLGRGLAKLPRLRTLALAGRNVVDCLVGDSLTSLALDTESIPGIAIDLPNLRHLSLVSMSTAGREPDRLADLFKAVRLPQLRRLDLCYLASDRLCARLVQSPLFAQLDELHLLRGTMSDDGAVALARNRRSEKLKRLTAHENVLSAAGIKTLENVAEKVSALSQGCSTDYWECGVPLR